MSQIHTSLLQQTSTSEGVNYFTLAMPHSAFDVVIFQNVKLRLNNTYDS